MVRFILGAGGRKGYLLVICQSRGAAFQEEGQQFEPIMAEEEREDLYEGWQQAVAATQQFKRKNK